MADFSDPSHYPRPNGWPDRFRRGGQHIGHWTLVAGTLLLWAMMIQMIDGCQSARDVDALGTAGDVDMGVAMLGLASLVVGGFLALVAGLWIIRSYIRFLRRHARPRRWGSHAVYWAGLAGVVGFGVGLERLTQSLVAFSVAERDLEPPSDLGHTLLAWLVMALVSALGLLVLGATVRSYIGSLRRPKA
jgi:hypothetical protein